MGRLSYEAHFKSGREDGRFVNSLAGFMEMIRRTRPQLALPEDISAESYPAWRKQVVTKYRELLHIPQLTRGEAPKRLSREARDGYTVEKWEHYPDEYTAVPFLVLIPDGASREAPVPGVICVPGSVHSKEFLSGEELLDPPNCRYVGFPERNEMAKYIVKNGMAAFVFDHVATCERGIPTSSPNVDGFNYHSRAQMIHGYLQAGLSYLGVTVYHMLSFMQYLSDFDFLDTERLGVSAHSLGTECAMALGVLCDEIKAIVFNDFLHSDRVRFCSRTELEEGRMGLDPGCWHIVPGLWEYFDFPDLCAAFAPKFVTFNEGGAEECFEVVRRAYDALGVPERLSVNHYPKYRDECSRDKHGTVPRYGLDIDGYFEWNYCDAPDHSYREEPSILLLRRAFGL